MTAANWENDLLQFTRLLAELRMAGYDCPIGEDLRESMSLTEQEVEEIFDRALNLFDKFKRHPPVLSPQGPYEYLLTGADDGVWIEVPTEVGTIDVKITPGADGIVIDAWPDSKKVDSAQPLASVGWDRDTLTYEYESNDN